nr:unnamed protein product [Callosobruchus analis]
MVLPNRPLQKTGGAAQPRNEIGRKFGEAWGGYLNYLGVYKLLVYVVLQLLVNAIVAPEKLKRLVLTNIELQIAVMLRFYTH